VRRAAGSLFVLFFGIIFCCGVFAQEAKIVKLPAPVTEGGKPLMQVLKERKSSRNLSAKELPDQVLSNLLWAAFGVNRQEWAGRTAPSAYMSLIIPRWAKSAIPRNKYYQNIK
jgi:hypothetical protein